MVWVMASLFVVACLLPIWGLVHLWLLTGRELERATQSEAVNDAAYNHLTGPVDRMLAAAMSARAEARRSFFLIGGGLVAGTVASVLALFT